jgi:UDP-N-acetylglucosamine 2-epimerase (non-hydrolysing)
MDTIFFKQLNLPQANFHLDVGSGSHAEQTAKILIRVEDILKKERPDIVLVEGDTNSVFAAAFAASKLSIKVGHVEAGLRSYDRQMPEEINRILTDHCSDYLFAPTTQAESILLGEGIDNNKIFVTGNTIVDAIFQHLQEAENKADIFDMLHIKPKYYSVLTLHRQENVDISTRFASILDGLNTLAMELQQPIIYPIHPRSRKMMTEFGLDPKNLKLVEPLDYSSFLQLEANACLILTDSGGVQEEACILGVPCVTIRNNTERPETLEVGSNVLAGVSADKIVSCSHQMLGRKNGWSNPFGDGRAGERIVSILEEKI